MQSQKQTEAGDTVERLEADFPDVKGLRGQPLCRLVQILLADLFVADIFSFLFLL